MSIYQPRTVNMELVEKVLARIHAEHKNGGWVQSTWAYVVGNLRTEASLDVDSTNPPCGTRMCFGGWALWLTGNYKIQAVPLNYGPDDQGYVYVNICRTDSDDDTQEIRKTNAELAAEILGFNHIVAEKIFYSGDYYDVDLFERHVREVIAEYGDYTEEQLVAALGE